jgi:heme exporter protein C
VSFTKAPSMAAAMFTGMMLMTAAFWLYSVAVAMVRVRCMIVERQ